MWLFIWNMVGITLNVCLRNMGKSPLSFHIVFN